MKLQSFVSDKIDQTAELALQSFGRLRHALATDRISAAELLDVFEQAYSIITPEYGLSKPDIPHLLSHPEIKPVLPEMQLAFNQAERALEEAASQNFIGRKSLTVEDLASFPQYNGFASLTDIEETLLRSQGYRRDAVDQAKTAFVGISALPISPLLLQSHIVTEIDCIDYVPESLSLGESLTRKIGANLKVNFIQQYPQNHDYTGYHTVFMAARAQPKEAIIKKLARTKSVKYLVLRVVDERARLYFQNLKADQITMHGFVLLSVSVAPPPFFQTSLLFENMNFSNMSRRHSMYVPSAMLSESYNYWYTPGSGGGGWHNMLYSRHQTSDMLSSYVETKGRSRFRIIGGKVSVTAPSSVTKVR